MNKNTQPAGVTNTAQVLEINKKRFVVGLFWWPLSKIATAKKEMAKFSKEQGMNMSVLYSGTAIQGGFGSAEKDHLKLFDGAYALAPVLASKLGASWLGVFSIGEDNYVLIAVQDGRVVPGCDTVGNRHEIRKVLEDVYSLYPWEKIYITDESIIEDLDSDRVDTRSLKDVLIDKRYPKDFKISADLPGQNLVLIGVVAILVAIGGGYYAFSVFENRREASILEFNLNAENVRNEAKVSEEKKKAVEEVNSARIVPPWPNTPRNEDMLFACEESFKKLPITIAGWVFTQASCSDESLEANYSRVEGTTMEDFFVESSRLRAQGDLTSFSLQPDKGAIKMDLPKMAARGEENIGTLVEWQMPWESFFQSMTIKAPSKLRVHPPPPAPKAWVKAALGDKESLPPPPWWSVYAWSFATKGLSAIDLMRVVPQAKGLVVKRITLKPGGPDEWSWVVEGEVNVKD